MSRPDEAGGLRRTAALAAAFAVVLGAVVSGAAIGVVDAETTSVSVVGEDGASSVQGSPGETLTLTVETNAQNVSAYQANLTFDSDVVEVKSVSGTDDFDDPVANVDNENGWAAFNQYRESNVDGPQLATVTVELVGDPGDETTLSFADADTKLANSAAEERSIDTYEAVTVSVESDTTETETQTETDTETQTETQTETETETQTETQTETETETQTETETETQTETQTETETETETPSDGSGPQEEDESQQDDSSDGGASNGDSGDNGDDGNGGSSASSSGGGGGGGGSGGGLSGPPRVASHSSMLLQSSTMSTSFGGNSPTFARFELQLDSEVFGKYSTTEFERLSSNLAYARDSGSSDVVAAVNVDAPDNAEDTPGRVTLTVKRDALDEHNASVDSLRVERYDDSASQWRVLDTEVVESNNETVTLRTESSRLGWFVVSTAESAQTSPTTESPTATTTTPETETETETETPTATEPTTEEEQTEMGDSDESSVTTQPAETETGTPGFGVVTVVLAVTTLLGYLRFRGR